MIPLSLLHSGERAMIQKVSGSQEVRTHLKDMGFVSGCDVDVISSLGGNIIVTVKGTRVALGSDMASKIFVGGAYENA